MTDSTASIFERIEFWKNKKETIKALANQEIQLCNEEIKRLREEECTHEFEIMGFSDPSERFKYSLRIPTMLCSLGGINGKESRGRPFMVRCKQCEIVEGRYINTTCCKCLGEMKEVEIIPPGVDKYQGHIDSSDSYDGGEVVCKCEECGFEIAFRKHIPYPEVQKGE